MTVEVPTKTEYDVLVVELETVKLRVNALETALETLLQPAVIPDEVKQALTTLLNYIAGNQ